jgi:hypothetical protein
MYKLPPAETSREYGTKVRNKIKEKEVKRAKSKAKKEIKQGKQATIKKFLERPV